MRNLLKCNRRKNLRPEGWFAFSQICLRKCFCYVNIILSILFSFVNKVHCCYIFYQFFNHFLTNNGNLREVQRQRIQSWCRPYKATVTSNAGNPWCKWQWQWQWQWTEVDANRNDGSEQCDTFLGPVTDKVELGDHRLREIWSVIIPTGTPRLNKWIYIPCQENLFPILFSPQPSFQTLPPRWLDTLCGLTSSRSRIWPRVGGSRLGCRWWARMGRNSPRLDTFSGMKKKSHMYIINQIGTLTSSPISKYI